MTAGWSLESADGDSVSLPAVSRWISVGSTGLSVCLVGEDVVVVDQDGYEVEVASEADYVAVGTAAAMLRYEREGGLS